MAKLKCKKEKECRLLLTYFINQFIKLLTKKKPKIKSVDSNILHFMIYKLVQKDSKLKKLIPFGWFIHGPYCYIIDDLLIEKFGMDQKYHQLEGTSPFNREFSDPEYET